MIIDISNIIIKTKRLTLRPLVMSDLADFFAVYSVPENSDMAGFAYHKTIDDSKAFLQQFIHDKNVFAIYHRADKKMMGTLTLHDSWANWDEEYKHLKISEFGSVIAKEYWGQGVVPEAIKAVIDYGFDVLCMDAFAACHFVGNDQSKRVVEKCGFKFMKMGVYHSKSLDRDFDELRYLRLKDT